jgi:hypothetical protein
MVLATLAGRGPNKAAERAAVAARQVTWFDFTVLCDVLGCADADVMPRRVRVPPDGFNKYDPDFVYRYRLLPDVTVSQFVDLAVAYSKAAVSWRWA